jgi:hypothetical protein
MAQRDRRSCGETAPALSRRPPAIARPLPRSPPGPQRGGAA